MKQSFAFINHKNLSEWREIDKVMYVESDLLAEGTYVGMDGIRTYYPAEVLDEANETILGKPIKIGHGENARIIGFWTKVKGNGKTRVGGHVFDPEGIEFLKKHPNYGLSMEGDALSFWDPEIRAERVQKLYYTAGSVVENPAFGGRIESTRVIRLEKPGKIDGGKEMTEDFIEFKENAKPTREAFFSWLEEQLKKKGVAEDEIKKIIDVLKGAIKSPYPYPYPKAGYPKAQASAVKISADALGIKEEEMSEYTDFMKECLKTKDMKACVAEWKAKHKEASEPDKDKVIATLKLKLQKAEEAINARLEEDISELNNAILKIDKEFNREVFLEGVEDRLTQKKMLSTYLDSLKRVAPAKPISLKLSADDLSVKRKKLAEEMFGSSDLMKHLEGE